MVRRWGRKGPGPPIIVEVEPKIPFAPLPHSPIINTEVCEVGNDIDNRYSDMYWQT